MPEMSMPRAATSVATRTRKWPFLKLLRVTSRWRWERSPWRTPAWRAPLKALAAKSSASRLVVVKTMAFRLRSSPSSTVITSSRSDARTSELPGTCMALCVTVVAVRCWSLPTTSKFNGLVMYCRLMSRIQGGVVAENNKVWAFSMGTKLRTRSMSLAKPMSSISSASSKTTWRTSARFSVPRSRWSMMRPGVATRMSMPPLQSRS
mmetsp:Transcript_15210/g.45023  ORF Transcript_15210/g.45023 Transcript_15210/m.45023 type:complete len:206 (+) Transcript_15210:766-1383(+)